MNDFDDAQNQHSYPGCDPVDRFAGLRRRASLGAERSNINITGYVINAQLDPSDHTLKATAKVTFTATDTVSSAIFELHNALKVDSVVDEQRHQLSGERGPNATISVALPAPLNKGSSHHAYVRL